MYAERKKKRAPIRYLCESVGIEISDFFCGHRFNGHSKHFTRELTQQAPLRASEECRRLVTIHL